MACRVDMLGPVAALSTRIHSTGTGRAEIHLSARLRTPQVPASSRDRRHQRRRHAHALPAALLPEKRSPLQSPTMPAICGHLSPIGLRCPLKQQHFPRTRPCCSFPASASRDSPPLLDAPSPSMREEEESSNECANLPSNLPNMAAIRASAAKKGIQVELQSLGPFFSLTTSSTCTGTLLGKANGFVRPWAERREGRWRAVRVLHLDTIRLAGEGVREGAFSRSVFGVALVVGAVAVRHGIDSGCERAELLAINDTDEYHEKLVRYYSRLGMASMREVTGNSLSDLPHMLVWGGAGTLMQGNLITLLTKWRRVFE